MAATIRGDFPKLREAISKIRKIGDAGPELWKRTAPGIRSRIEAEFSTGTNPYGTPWKALAPATIAKGRSAPPLTETGRMRSSLAVLPEGWTLHVIVRDPKAGFHQFGTGRRLAAPRKITRRSAATGKREVVAMKFATTHIPKRQILPNGRVPNEWRQFIRRTARAIMSEKLGRKVTRGEMR